MRAFLCLTSLLLSGCVTHGAKSANEPGTGAHGAEGLVTLHARATSTYPRRFTAELLEVTDTTLLLASGRDIVLAHVRAVARLDLTGIHNGRPNVGKLRKRARYQQPLTAEQLRRLLAAYNRDSVIRVWPAGTRDDRNPPLHSHHQADTSAQGSSAFQDFLSRARHAVEPYTRLENAIAAGYRRIGPSFPGMGEHWIHPGLLVSGQIDPARPPVLCYERIAGKAQLIALAFATPLAPGESLPPSPVPAAVWHGHSDHVDEEVLLLARNTPHDTKQDAHTLAMFHAWLLDNPDGPVEQNNWRLPFARAGLNTHALQPSADAGRALSLVTADPDYYLRIFQAAASPDSSELRQLAQLIATHRAEVQSWVKRAHTVDTLGPAQLKELEDIWSAFWQSIAGTVKKRSWPLLARLR